MLTILTKCNTQPAPKISLMNTLQCLLSQLRTPSYHSINALTQWTHDKPKGQVPELIQDLN
jgi:hypothetical protein